ncbi:condensation domain-containing protein [Streptomyces sp. NPDC048172]|uniref:condensation domain-containing protein n=1 Tax=Streptomyces sp. NPDC048172 TaxID=3365505 RepID=UPI003718188C
MTTAQDASREEELLRRARRRRAEKGEPGAPGPGDGGSAPLSYAQRRMWLMDRLGEDGTAYHVPFATRLRGPLDVAALGRAFAALTRRHEVLRTRYEEHEGEPRQRTVDAGPPLAPRLVEEPWPATRTLREEAARPFDLAAGPLPRALVVRHGPEDHTVLLTFHHIAVDGTSLGVLGRELAELYGAELAGRTPELPVDVPRYADFARREQSRVPELEAGLEHWLTRLAGARPVPLPPPSNGGPAEGVRVLRRPLPEGALDGLRATGVRHRTTPFAVVLAAAYAALLRTTGHEDLVIGCAADHRDGTRTRDLVGLCVNTLPLRVHTGGAEDLDALVGLVRDALLEALGHRDVPFDMIVERLGGGARDSKGNPLLSVTADLLPEPAALSLPGTRGEPVEVDLGTAKFGLSLCVEDVPGGARCLVQYDAARLDDGTARRLLDAFDDALRAAAGTGRLVLERPGAEPGHSAHPALALLRERPEVADAVLVEREGQPPLAFVVPDPRGPGRGASPTALRAALRARLEPRLVPERVTLVDALPRTGGGEADTAQLPGLEPGLDSPAAGTRAPFTGPRARTVLAAFGELLGDEPGPDADFFLLGGHSLLAVQLAERLRERLRLPLTGLDVMEHRTPRALVALLDERARARASATTARASSAAQGTRTVLVTGATGGVGAFVVRELAARGFAVRALARPESAHLAEPGTEVVEGNLRDLDGLRRAAEGADAIVHAACTFTDHEADRAAMRALLDGWRRGPFVFVSSTDAHGEAETLSAYGRAKRDCERMLLEADRREGASALRAPIVWGGHDRFRDQLRWGATGEFYQAVRNGGSVALPGPEAGWYGAPWVHAAALARAVARCVERPTGGVLDAVGGHVGWADFVTELGRLAGDGAGVSVTPLDGEPDPRHRHRFTPEPELAEELAERPGEDWRSALTEMLSAE